MADENNKPVKVTWLKCFLFIAFFAIGYLTYKNYILSEKLDYYIEYTKEFHENLYASQTGSLTQGTHSLSISDIYYQKYFNTNEKEK